MPRNSSSSGILSLVGIESKQRAIANNNIIKIRRQVLQSLDYFLLRNLAVQRPYSRVLSKETVRLHKIERNPRRRHRHAAATERKNPRETEQPGKYPQTKSISESTLR
ncbi:hypothetical protein KQX54_006315 [Cotesia glomerata]|uniref:Uncharacterized protein n=1 Tax=Cotesia glomerata TaxID=32391 RepID=A0AAV7HPG5_COTGL|nr:hypothetical protein KQX54_006315 [Cotesia glomerata]